MLSCDQKVFELIKIMTLHPSQNSFYEEFEFLTLICSYLFLARRTSKEWINITYLTKENM